MRFRLLIGSGIFVFFTLWYWRSLPDPLFMAPYSAVLEDRNGKLLGAHIASDGQWRFPIPDSLPDRYVQAVVTFEDKRFFSHPGVDLLALVRAAGQNLKAGRIVSGGSTISMQTIRLARSNPKRTLIEKALEAILATRLEWLYSKDEILQLYAGNAPFGGNVVGLETACWRYFGKTPTTISWSEAALLAVLPNSPSLLHPGRNRQKLQQKRDRLLEKLMQLEYMDSLSYSLALEEPLPEQALALPQWAPHLLDRVRLEAKTSRGKFKTTLDATLQRQIQERIQSHALALEANHIYNAAALITHLPTGEVLAYVGNRTDPSSLEHANQVDIITSPRSTGSILKPLLYALALESGTILPKSLLPDIPMSFNGYRPENYSQSYTGLISAREALVQSLNIPFVHLLRDFGQSGFHNRLRSMGLESLTQSADHYGLSLILGGSEATLWEIHQLYAGLVQHLQNSAQPNSLKAHPTDRPAIHYLPRMANNLEGYRPDPGALWLTFNAMRAVQRPAETGRWEAFSSNQPIAWKTGTSFGFRDAWAVGFNAEYQVSIWVGNADGEGRTGLTGIQAAAPILFDLFELLPPGEWFEQPFDNLYPVPVCQKSGWKAGPYCPADTILAPKQGARNRLCPYHRLLHLDPEQQFQVHRSCFEQGTPRLVHWFVLPTPFEHYYARVHPEYSSPPPWKPGCYPPERTDLPLAVIYPEPQARIRIPRQLNGELSATVFQATHREPSTVIYWHLDENYLGSTSEFHTFTLTPEPGTHVLTLVDEDGLRVERTFTIEIPQ